MAEVLGDLLSRYRVLDLPATAAALRPGLGSRPSVDQLAGEYGIPRAEAGDDLLPDFWEALLWAVVAEAGRRGCTWPALLDAAQEAIQPAPFERYTFDAESLACLPARPAKYRQVVRVGSAVYLNHAMGNVRVVGAFLSAEERAKLLEHNTFFALDTTDQYAWFYLEASPHSFWRNQLPPGTVEAVRSARERYREGNRVGLKRPAFARAKAQLEHYRATAMDSVQPSIATIRKMGPNRKTPVIDGNLDDPVWKTVQPLAEFTVRLQDAVNPKNTQFHLVSREDRETTRPDMGRTMGKRHSCRR